MPAVLLSFVFVLQAVLQGQPPPSPAQRVEK